jgi:hypothetical protein
MFDAIRSSLEKEGKRLPLILWCEDNGIEVCAVPDGDHELSAVIGGNVVSGLSERPSERETHRTQEKKIDQFAQPGRHRCLLVRELIVVRE